MSGTVTPLSAATVDALELTPTSYVNPANVTQGEAGERGHTLHVSGDGTSRSFGPGESYIMTKGWSGTFRIDSSFTKYFVLYVG
jgi:hypothetical protein